MLILASGSVEKLMMAIVSVEITLFSQTMVSCLPFSTPLTSAPQRRAVLRAVSTAWRQVHGEITLPVSLQRLSKKSQRTALWNARDVSVTRSSCAFAAAMISGEGDQS